MGPMTFAQYRNLLICLKKLDYDKKDDDIKLAVEINIPPECHPDTFVISFVRNYIQKVIEAEIKTEIGRVTIGMFNQAVHVDLHYDKNDLEPAKKLKLFCQTLTALMKIHLVNAAGARSLTLDFIKHHLPEYLNQEVSIGVRDKNILIYRTPDALVNMAFNKVSFFLMGNQLEKKALEMLPEELAKKFNTENEQDLPSTAEIMDLS